MNIDKFRNFVLFVAKKSVAGANPTPADFNLATERAFVEWVMERYSNPQQYRPGQPIPQMAWQQTQKISDDLGFLLENRTFTVPSTGRLSLPDGLSVRDIDSAVTPKYLHLSSVRSVYVTKRKSGALRSREIGVSVLRDNELASVLGSSIIEPTERFPVCAFYNTYVQFHPQNIGKVALTYLRTPEVPIWAYTLDTSGRPVYDPNNSIDIESPDSTHNEIAIKVLSYLGISIREPQLTQYAEIQEQQ